MLLICIMYALFGMTFVIGKAALQFVSPIAFIAFRMIIAGILLSCYQKFYLKQKLGLSKTDFMNLSWLSLVHIYVPYVFEFWALQYVSSAKAAMLFSLSPFATAILAYILLKEKLSLKKILGLIIGCLGFLPILIINSCKELPGEKLCNFYLPEIALVISVVSASYAWIFIQNKLQQNSYSLIKINGVSMLFGGFLALFTSFIFEPWSPAPINNYYYFAILTLLIIIIGNILCYNMYGLLLNKYTATFLSFAGFMTPLFTAFFQFVIFKEPVSLSFFATLIFVFIGLYIFYQEELRHGITKV